MPTEQDYDTIRELGKKLHIPTPEMFWGFKVEKIDGEVLHEHDERGHSWVRNAYNLLISQMCAIGTGDTTFGEGLISAKTTTAVIKGGGSYKNPLTVSGLSQPETSGCGFCGGIGDDSIGIVIGKGLTPFNFEQYRLDSIIPNGGGAGQFAYQSFNPIIKEYNVGSKIYKVTHSRVFNNNSSSSITVTEVGIYNKMVNEYNTLVTRDVLTTPIVVPPASKLTISYNISVAFPT